MPKNTRVALMLMWVSGAALASSCFMIYRSYEKYQQEQSTQLKHEKQEREWAAFRARTSDPRYLGDRWLDSWTADKSIIRLADCVDSGEMIYCDIRQDKI